MGQYLIKPHTVLGDFESMIHSNRDRQLYLTLDMEPGRVNLLATRIALDKNILPVPPFQNDDDEENPLVLGNYLRNLPSGGLIYAMRGGVLLNYSLRDLRRDWKRLFVPDPIYLGLRCRYEGVEQALSEFHHCEQTGILRVLQQRLYGRETAHTLVCAMRSIWGAAIGREFSKFFETLPKLIVCANPLSINKI